MGNDEHLKKAFELFDQNQSGYIEIEELRDSLADEVDTGEEVISAIMLDVDTDKVRFVFLFAFHQESCTTFIVNLWFSPVFCFLV